MKLTLNTNRVSSKIITTVKAENDEQFYAVTVKASKIGMPYGMMFGISLVKSNTAGFISLDSPVKEYIIPIDSSCFTDDGEWRICVFLRNKAGVWNDTCRLFANNSECLIDSNGAIICCQRDYSGTDEAYKSCYSSEEINAFAAEILGY